jgi:hypothetical protein
MAGAHWVGIDVQLSIVGKGNKGREVLIPPVITTACLPAGVLCRRLIRSTLRNGMRVATGGAG